MEILGLIPARGGSQGLPGKNIRPLCGKPLIAHTIEAALAAKRITRVVVATDCPEIAEVARTFGAETPFVRPPSVSGPTSHAFEIYKYTIEILREQEGYRPDVLCAMLCTTPLRNAGDIDGALARITDDGCDWSFTVNEMEHHPYRAMVPQGDLIKPLFDVPRGMLWANRQELPRMFRFNGGVLAGRTEHIEGHEEYNIDNLDFAHVKVGYHEMPVGRSADIDTLDDFNRAETLMGSLPCD